MNPAPTPFVMLNVSGWTRMISKAGIPISGLDQLMSLTSTIMK